ncbi:MAG: helicase RepA family protein, partial [Pseudomonadota bacterium]|nr:helicase RepA family protein [Pseudomonadota bacterium]
MADEDPIIGLYARGFKAEDANVYDLPKKVALELRPAEDIDPKLIPPRRWLYGRALVRSFVSVLVAPGGTGKSLWAMAVGVSLATGISLLGEHVFSRTNVWLINLDDPMDELNRRFAALRMHYNLKTADWHGRFFMNSGEERALVMAKMEMSQDGFSIVHPDEKALEQHILDNNIGLLIVDPFAESHTLEENSNPQMVAATAAWRRVARRTGCSILLVHHVRKGGGGDIESARGAKALTDSARVGLVMSTMSPEEAEALGIAEEDRLRYVRMDDAKANLAPRAGAAKWF